MATWPNKIEWTDIANINKGSEYTPADGILADDFNSLIKNIQYLHLSLKQLPVANQADGVIPVYANSLVLNDLVYNYALDEYALAAGHNTRACGPKTTTFGEMTGAGVRGYDIVRIEGSTLYLDPTSAIAYQVGDKVSYSTYDEVGEGWRPGVDNGTIISIDDKNHSVTLAETLVGLSNGLPTKDSRLAYKLYCFSKPYLGPARVSSRAFAINRQNLATGDSSFAKGRQTQSRGDYSETGGRDTKADAEGSRAHGWGSHAKAWYSSAEGAFTVTEEGADYSEATGEGTVATAPSSRVGGRFNIKDIQKEYLEIVGNGTNHNQRSNARTLDRSGNAWYAGNVFVGKDKNILLTGKELEPIEKRLQFLELVNEGHTFAFVTDKSTSKKKNLPSNSLPTVVLERVDGRMLTYMETQSPDYTAVKFEGFSVIGKNRIKYPYYSGSYYQKNGITFEVNSDGSVYAHGTATGTADFFLQRGKDKAIITEVEYASGYTYTGNVYSWNSFPNTRQGFTVTDCVHAYNPVTGDAIIYISIPTGAVLDKVFYPQIEYGLQPTEFSRYKETTFSFDYSSLEDYAYGYATDYVSNYVDLVKKQYVQTCKLLKVGDPEFNGLDLNRTDIKWNMSYTAACVPLDEPFVKDISKLLTFDNVFEVQSGGLVEFYFKAVGFADLGSIEYDEAAPSTIHYQVRL